MPGKYYMNKNKTEYVFMYLDSKKTRHTIRIISDNYDLALFEAKKVSKNVQLALSHSVPSVTD